MTGSTPAPGAASSEAPDNAFAAAQNAAIGLSKLSPSPSMGVGFGLSMPQGKGDPSLSLTPYLSSPFGSGLSPWMQAQGLGGASPIMIQQAMSAHAAAAASVAGQQYKHHVQQYKHQVEHNKFQHSFSAALGSDTDPSAANSDAEVPEMAGRRGRVGAAFTHSIGAASDRMVPKGRKGGAKSKVATKKAGKKAGKATSKPQKKERALGRGPLPEDLRREKRREQNRVNAAKCRQRKLDKVDQLQLELDDLVAEHSKLQRKYADVEAQLQATYRK